jgi:hypothetical protein
MQNDIDQQEKIDLDSGLHQFRLRAKELEPHGIHLTPVE